VARNSARQEIAGIVKEILHALNGNKTRSDGTCSETARRNCARTRGESGPRGGVPMDRAHRHKPRDAYLSNDEVGIAPEQYA